MTDAQDGRLQTLEHHGCALAYRLRGSGPPVLFIQGVGVHGDGWLPQVDALADRFTCLTFDNRGMAASQPVGTQVTVEQMADDARALLDAVGWPSAHVVGHSLGGVVALHLALACRERVRSLALLCTFGRGRDAAPATATMIWAGLRSRVGTRRSRRHGFLQLVLPPALLASADRDALAQQLEPIFGHDLGDQPPVAGAQLAALRAYDAMPRLGELAELPTLVASATHDLIAPPSIGRRLAAGIPGARFVELADAAHGVTIHDPQRINELLAEHLTSA